MRCHQVDPPVDVCYTRMLACHDHITCSCSHDVYAFEEMLNDSPI